MKIKLSMVELFYGHRCNLSCKGCTSFSDKIKDTSIDPTLESMFKSIDDLSKFTDVERIDLMGGEIFLYWETIEKLSEHIRKKFPQATIGIGTNGLLLKKFQDRVIEYSKKFNPCVIDITNHFTLFSSDNISRKLHRDLAGFVKENNFVKTTSVSWGVPDDSIDVYRSSTSEVRIADAKKFYTCYYTDASGKLKPYSTNNPADSYKNGCAMPSCHLLYNSKLYKCSWFAFLPTILKITNQQNDASWKKYLEYNALDLINPSIQNLIDFSNTANTHINLCDMCSNKKEISIIQNKINVIPNAAD